MANETKVVGKAPPKNEDVAPQQQLPTGPTAGELEERQAMLEEENLKLRASLARLEALLGAAGAPPAAQAAAAARRSGSEPVFDPDEPHGIVVGDSEVAFVQNGHEFGRDKTYLRTDPNHGSGRAFNPRLVGVVKPPRLAPAA